MQIEESPRPAAGGWALWSLGFRPFYLAASVFAALSVLLWACEYAGWLPGSYMQTPFRHAHEMLFGYTLAVLAGFLFTAVRNWTSRPTPTGGTLAAIVALWIAGRLMVLTPFDVASAFVNAAFPLAVAIGIGIPLVRSGNRRNYFFVVLLVALAAIELLVHASELGWMKLPETWGLQLGLDLVLFIVVVMAGRIVPMFTNNGVPGAVATRNPIVERLAMGSVLALVAADLAGIEGSLFITLLAVSAAVHAVRWLLWRPWRTLRAPLVWILHLAYAWVPVYLVLRIFAIEGSVAPPWAIHALTIGVIGGMTLGMMTRTARGHTGQPLVAGAAEVAMYVLVQLAAVVRVFGPLFAGAAYVTTVAVAALLWASAFALYALRYAPLLARPRADGRPG
ncbi:MAG TPA: NnrS family protein [Usitatibacter sp.]|jgi:uncharacterized protein involved in response to NO|nr:NnrS family protein [Usitatibacter sp.]